jgi:hypothetical protein
MTIRKKRLLLILLGSGLLAWFFSHELAVILFVLGMSGLAVATIVRLVRRGEMSYSEALGLPSRFSRRGVP